jgi:hypothetical protein
MNRNALIRATVIGTLLQVAMSVSGHFVAFIALHVFAIGGTTISAVAGVIYALSAREKLRVAAIGGAVAGAVCALIGIVVAVVLGDAPQFVLVIGTVSGLVAGAIGGVIGALIARARAA